jgi:hypothetical protein
LIEERGSGRNLFVRLLFALEQAQHHGRKMPPRSMSVPSRATCRLHAKNGGNSPAPTVQRLLGPAPASSPTHRIASHKGSRYHITTGDDEGLSFSGSLYLTSCTGCRNDGSRLTSLTNPPQISNSSDYGQTEEASKPAARAASRRNASSRALSNGVYIGNWVPVPKV